MDWWDNSQEDRIKTEEELRPFEEQGGGTGLCRRLGRRDAYTAKTRMEHMGNGEQKRNDDRRTGTRCGATRDVRNTFTKVSDTTRSKRDHIVKGNTPKREDEGPHIKRC